jgi:hypothetical protein
MSCCGQQRAGLSNGSNSVAGRTTTLRYSYTGVRAIIVKGEATGHVYRFAPGSSLHVHGGDATYMQGIPGLRPDPMTAH